MSESLPELVGADVARLDLGARSRLRVRGGDRVRFLAGMLSNAIEDQAVGVLRDSLQLDRKGHVLAQLWVWMAESEVLLDAEPGSGAALTEMLAKHIVADDVELESLDEAWSGLALEGPGTR